MITLSNETMPTSTKKTTIRFLNVECGAGVFTHVMNPTQIKIEHSESKHVLIDVTNDLATVSQQVEAFLNTL
jgi:ascorbate-specific PTS system EIIC-type component UlaA